MFTPAKHPTDVTITVGSHGLGLILTEDKEGSRWGVKGLRVMPDGQKNPAEVSFFFFFLCFVFYRRKRDTLSLAMWTV